MDEFEKIKVNSSDLILEHLKMRFGADNMRQISTIPNEISLYQIDIPKEKVSILTTIGLSNYEMPVPEKMVDRKYNELFFCLPNYWDINDTSNEKFNWVFHWIERLTNYVIDKKSWFGPGHTMPCGNPFQSLSSSMLENHFFLIDPILLKDELIPIKLENKEIYLLGIVPIFEDEMDYKQGKGTYKLLKKFNHHGITEKLDDFRGSILKSKWRFRIKK